MALAVNLAVRPWERRNDDSPEQEQAQTAVTLAPEDDPALSPCRFSSIDDTQRVFGGPVAVETNAAGGCEYGVRGGGRASVLVLIGDRRPLSSLGPATDTVESLGDAAVWDKSDGRPGGLLLIRAAQSLIIIDVYVFEPDDQVRGKAVAWAETIIPRVVEEAGDNPPPPPPSSPEEVDAAVCGLVTEEERAAAIGAWQRTESRGDGVCRFSAPSGSTVELGPLTRPAATASLSQIRRESTVNGETVVWPSQQVESLGQAARVLTDPVNPGRVELFVLSGGALLRVGVGGEASAEAAMIVATAVAEVAIR